MDSKRNITDSPLLFPVSDLTWDQFVYPRAGKSDKTVSAYVEALAMGAQFPPIKIQRVFNCQHMDLGYPCPAESKQRHHYHSAEPPRMDTGHDRGDNGDDPG